MSDDALLDQRVAVGSPPGADLYRDLFLWRDLARGRHATGSLRFVSPARTNASLTQVAEELRRQGKRGAVLFEMSSSTTLEMSVVDPAIPELDFPNDVLSEQREFVTAAVSATGQFDVTRVRRVLPCGNGILSSVERMGQLVTEDGYLLTLVVAQPFQELKANVSVVEIRNTMPEIDGSHIVDSVVRDDGGSERLIVVFRSATPIRATSTPEPYKEIWNSTSQTERAILTEHSRIESRALYHIVLHEGMDTSVAQLMQPMDFMNAPAPALPWQVEGNSSESGSRGESISGASNRTGSPRRLQRKEPPGFSRRYQLPTPQFIPPSLGGSLSSVSANATRDKKQMLSIEMGVENEHSTYSVAATGQLPVGMKPPGIEDVIAVPPNVLWPTPIEPPSAPLTQVVPTTRPLPLVKCVPDVPMPNNHPLAATTSAAQNVTQPSVLPTEQTLIPFPMDAATDSRSSSSPDPVRFCWPRPSSPVSQSPLTGSMCDAYDMPKGLPAVPLSSHGLRRDMHGSPGLPIQELIGKSEDETIQWTLEHLQNNPDLLKQFLREWMDDSGQDVFIEKLMALSSSESAPQLPLPREFPFSHLYDKQR